MRLLDFNSYERLLLEEEGNDVSTITSQIVSSFLDAYSAALSASPGYSKIMNDLDSLVEGDAKTKMESMKRIADSITSSINSDFSDISDDIKKSMDEAIKAYDILISQEEKSEEGLKSIANSVSKSIVRFSSSLKDAKKDVSESLRPVSKYELILEASRHKKQRDTLISNLTAVLAGVDAKIQDKALSSMKSFLEGMQKELMDLADKLNDDKYWDEIKKRKDRLDELEKISSRLAEIGPSINAKSMEALRRLNADKDIMDSLSNSKKFLEEALKKFTEIREKQISEETEKKAKEKDEEYANIDPKDPQNMRRSGSNREKIMDYQKKTNDILKDTPGYKSIDADGLYGEKTKDAFKRLQELLNKLGAGLNVDGSLTAETQKVIDNFIKNKDSIRDILKK